MSPLDPGLFVGVDEFVRETLARRQSGRVSPLRVAVCLDALANSARAALARAEQCTAQPSSPRFRRLAVDVALQAGLARFFAGKLRAGIAYAMYRATGDRARLKQALEVYREARTAWSEVAEHGRVYRADLTVGGEPWLRGHWSDRLAAIDADLGDMCAEWERLGGGDVAPAGPLSDLSDRSVLAGVQLPGR